MHFKSKLCNCAYISWTTQLISFRVCSSDMCDPVPIFDSLLVFTLKPCSKEGVPSYCMRPPCVTILALLPWEHVVLNAAYGGGGAQGIVKVWVTDHLIFYQYHLTIHHSSWLHIYSAPTMCTHCRGRTGLQHRQKQCYQVLSYLVFNSTCCDIMETDMYQFFQSSLS